MPVTQNFDDVDVFYMLNEDGESCRTTTVLGKTAYDKALADGWTPIISPNGVRNLPKLPFPTALYRPIAGTNYGEVLAVNNRAEMNEAMQACGEGCYPGCRKHGWDRIVRAARPVSDAPEPIVLPKGDSANAAVVELAMQLVAANTRATEQDKAIEELRVQNAAILAALQNLPQGKAAKVKTEAELTK